MTTSVAGTDTSNPNLYYCFESNPTYDGYVSQDSSNPVTDSQCQNKVCGSSGWYAQNRPDGTSCTYNGQPSTCRNGLCQPLIPCTATLSVPTNPQTAPCIVSASVSATGCDGQTFAIKDLSGNSVCSGIILAGSGSCAAWTISSDTSYSLFIGGSLVPSDMKTASCGTSKVI